MLSCSPCPPAFCPGERDAEAWLTWEHRCLPSCEFTLGAWGGGGWSGSPGLAGPGRLPPEAEGSRACCASPAPACTWEQGNQCGTTRQQVRAAKVWCLPRPCPGCVPTGLGRVPARPPPTPAALPGVSGGVEQSGTQETEMPCSPRPAAHWDREGHAFRPSSVGLPREGGARNWPGAPHLMRVQGNDLGPMDLVAPPP